VSASELNTLLITVCLAIVAWVGRKLIKSVDALSDTVTRLGVVLLGTEDQGGLVRRVEGVARQGHDHASKIQALQGDVEELKEGRRPREH